MACKKSSLNTDITSIQTPATTPIRFIHFINGQYLMGGGESEKNGFLLSADPTLQHFRMLSDSFPLPLYDAAYHSGRYLFTNATAEVVYSYDLQTFFPHYLKSDNFVPDLHQRPARRITFSTDSSVLCIASGGAFEYGLIQFSADTFQTWVPFTFENELRTIVFDQKGIGWAGGFGVLLRSTDMGKSWKRAEFDDVFISDIVFFANNKGVVSTFNGQFYHSDNGIKWEKAKTKGQAFVNRVCAISSTKLVAVGNDGSLCLSEDAGKTWSCEKKFDGENLYDMHVLSNNKVLICSESGRLYATSL
jgi:hypothetical protein